MLLADVVTTSERVAEVPGRLAKIGLLADALRRLAPEEVAAGMAFLSGRLVQRQIGVGWAALRELPAPAEDATLSVGAVADVFARLGMPAGPGSERARRGELLDLLRRATVAEQRFLQALLLDGLRQGASEGVMVEAVARAAAVDREEVRRALMLGGDPGAIAAIALTRGAPGLRRVGLEVGRPIQPMLAGTAPDLPAALRRVRPAIVEAKLDGARIQVHRQGGEVGVFTRSLDDVTARVPEVVELALALRVRSVVLDGEAIVLRDDGRPQPFQVTGSRFGSSQDVGRLRATLPLSPFLFDMLHLDGQDLIDRSTAERLDALDAVVPGVHRVARAVASDADGAAAFQASVLAAGHEGVMVKSPAAPYAAGRRGGEWLKVKPRHTFDLVVLAAEWGHGRRQGWLSNLHLAARDPASGGFVMLGKTFKGLTDAMLTWQTERLLALEERRTAGTVWVRPELVVEVAFDGVQASTRYPGGVALRFARVLRHRPDKSAAEADPLEAVLTLRPG